MLSTKTIEAIENKIGYTFNNKLFLSQAFTRSSYRNEHTGTNDNEVLEFVGDAALSLAIVNTLCQKFTAATNCGFSSCRDEGDLSVLRSALVNKKYLAKQMSKLGLQDYLLMSAGDQMQGVQNSQSVLEDLFESIIGAAYLDSGKDLNAVTKVVNEILDVDNFLKECDKRPAISYKNDLQEWCQRYGYPLPIYDTSRCIDGDGFISMCQIAGFTFPWGRTEAPGLGRSKKEAENQAAKCALKGIEEFEKEYLNKQDSSTADNNNDVAKVCENAINILQEYCQSKGLPLPQYTNVEDKTNSDNSHTFTVKCSVADKSCNGVGNRLKDAKKQSAYNMLVILKPNNPAYQNSRSSTDKK